MDYPKSGQPVPLDRIPRLKFKVKPDWNAPETTTNIDPSRFYRSERAIGVLYRAIDLPAVETVRREQRHQRRRLNEGEVWTLDDILQEFRQGMDLDDEMHQALLGRVASFIALGRHEEDIIAEIWELFRNYVSQLQSICADLTLSHQRNAMLTEEEAIVGTIVAKCSQPRHRKDNMSKMRDQTTATVDSIRYELSGEEGTLPEMSMERAWVAYCIAYIQDDAFGARSFAWIAMGEIFDAIKTIEEDAEGMFY